MKREKKETPAVLVGLPVDVVMGNNFRSTQALTAEAVNAILKCLDEHGLKIEYK